MKIFDLPRVAIIGKEGLCTRGQNAAPGLWAEANAHFAEVADLGMKDPDGSYTGFWGAMSDKGRNFLPWEDDFTTGLYLAGVEVPENAQAPEGWAKWVLPARRYLAVEVEPERYADIFAETLRSLPERHLRLAGAVCDFTDPGTGKSSLFFPVEDA